MEDEDALRELFLGEDRLLVRMQWVAFVTVPDVCREANDLTCG